LDPYNFSLAWRYPLDSIESSGLTVYNYDFSDQSMLSYTVELAEEDSSGAVLSFNPEASIPKVVMIAFTVIIISQGNPNM
jgi:hypothetical protein